MSDLGEVLREAGGGGENGLPAYSPVILPTRFSRRDIALKPAIEYQKISY
jgi:hypothetical protein